MVIIIGSGAGGGLLAWELANSGIPVTILEKGPYIESKDALNYYDPSSEGLDLLKTSCIGGSTVVSCGNGVRILEDEFEGEGLSAIKTLVSRRAPHTAQVRCDVP